jgi:urea transport system permease protein
MGSQRRRHRKALRSLAHGPVVRLRGARRHQNSRPTHRPKDERDTQAALRIDTGAALTGPSGPLRLNAADLTAVEHTASLRRAMKAVLDLADLAAPDPAKRVLAIQTIGSRRTWKNSRPSRPAPRWKPTRRPRPCCARPSRSSSSRTKTTTRASPPSSHSRSCIPCPPPTRSIAPSRKRKQPGNGPVTAAAREALRAVENHRSFVDFFGTLFRGISLGSILLVAALGLAITFGLMRVINMAHGEMIAVGAYTTYLVQNVFGTGITIPFFGFSLPIPGMDLSGAAYQGYFLAALPCSFIAAALVGIGLERSVIRFLYRRPLESLLATWGVSLVLQQCFRLMFGANNVQVSSPVYLSGNWTVNDIIFGWNRVFVVGFAILIVFGMWLVLTKTSLGLLIRASMQNRTMASCMGVRTERVNMLTFGLGSGLAGLAGAFLSQIGNVGPSLGQGYIIDSFMVVVVGGVGSIGGTIISAFGIGGIDQVLQQYLPVVAPGLGWVPGIGGFLQNLAQDAAVFGKILVLAGIILFLQWKPAGLFVTRSRSLED